MSGTGVRVSLLLPSEIGCPHHYSLTPGDLNKLMSADLVVLNGLGFEPFLEKVILELGRNKILDLSKDSAFISNEENPSIPNPHIFSTPSGLISMANNLGHNLESRFPVNKAGIRYNLAKISKALISIAETWASESMELASTPVIITHESLAYSVRDLKLEVVGKLGFQEEEGREPSAGEMIAMTNLVREKRPRAILCDDQHPDISALTLSKETGVPIINWNTLVAGPLAAPENYAADKFRENIAVLKMTLAGSGRNLVGGNNR